MLVWLSDVIFYHILGWRVAGSVPADLRQFVMIVAPHTSWIDFPVGLMGRKRLQLDIKFIGKHTLFKPPFGNMFYRLGGYPVDRTQNHNFVQAVVDVFQQNKDFKVVLSPEGTRKKVAKLKSGFYYIAKQAGVPIVPVAFDFTTREVRVLPPFFPSDNVQADLQKVWALYRNIKGYHPKKSIY